MVNHYINVALIKQRWVPVHIKVFVMCFIDRSIVKKISHEVNSDLRNHIRIQWEISYTCGKCDKYSGLIILTIKVFIKKYTLGRNYINSTDLTKLSHKITCENSYW